MKILIFSEFALYFSTSLGEQSLQFLEQHQLTFDLQSTTQEGLKPQSLDLLISCSE
jgi:hypothetical protein